jgi:hypothetical protein
MRTLIRITKTAILMMALIFMLGFPVSALANEGTGTMITGDFSEVTVEQTASPAADVVGTADAAAETRGSSETQGSDPEAIPDSETPLNIRPYERGWSLVNLVAALLTIIIGVGLVGFSMVQRQHGGRMPDNFGLTVFGMAAAVISTILFTSTEDVQSQMIAVDGFTVIHITVLGIAFLCAFLSVRKDLQKDVQDTIFR